MKTVLITTGDDLLGNIFWESYKIERAKSFNKIILLPSRTDVGFSLLLQPIVAVKLLRLAGIIELVRLKIFGKNVSVESMCEELVELTSFDPQALYDEVKKSDTDVLVSVGAPIVFDSDLLAIPRVCSLNLHNGDIRKYRGHFSTFWEIINKEESLVLTLHEMTSKVDSGLIYDQQGTLKSERSSFLDVMIWKKSAGGKMLAGNLNLIERGERQGTRFDRDDSRYLAKYYSFPTLHDVLAFRF